MKSFCAKSTGKYRYNRDDLHHSRRLAGSTHAAKVGLGAETSTIIIHLKVAVVAGRVTRGANQADDIALVHGLACCAFQLRHMRIQRAVAVAVVDNNIIAIAVMPTGSNDLAGIRCNDGGTVSGTDIGTLMVRAHPAADIGIVRNRPYKCAAANAGNHAAGKLSTFNNQLCGRVLQTL